LRINLFIIFVNLFHWVKSKTIKSGIYHEKFFPSTEFFWSILKYCTGDLIKGFIANACCGMAHVLLHSIGRFTYMHCVTCRCIWELVSLHVTWSSLECTENHNTSQLYSGNFSMFLPWSGTILYCIMLVTRDCDSPIM